MGERESAVHVVVRGRVQGVFYRASVRERAEASGLRGWVRNTDDGAVEALLAGPADAVEELVTWMQQGPPDATVFDVVTEPADDPGSGFAVR
ncbi:acylphosphatase [Mumia sp. DW29H23]|uniref:acylphosphatase n=1 Tax=Mumia sp. DW29H23 TaxID=3421241 RepID=UPI003D692B8D